MQWLGPQFLPTFVTAIPLQSYNTDKRSTKAIQIHAKHQIKYKLHLLNNNQRQLKEEERFEKVQGAYHTVKRIKVGT